MKLMFGEIEEILRAVHSIPDSDKARFRARLRNLIRVGLQLPSGTAGRKANYHPADLMKIAFAVELTQAGIPPEPAAITTAQYWPDGVEQIFAARAEMQAGKKQSSFLIAEPSALATPIYRFTPVTGEELSEKLIGLPGLLMRRLIVISPPALLLALRKAVSQSNLDYEAFEAVLDEAQDTILKQGARVYGNRS